MTGVSEAFVFGLASSLHCAAMCGPLAACACGGALGVTAYQTARWMAYVAAGALAGSLGGAVGLERMAGPHAGVALVLAAALLLGAAGAGRWWRAAPGTGRLSAVVGRIAWRLPPLARGTLLGAVTPVLPCGVLVGLYAAAAAAGSAAGGALTTAAFALGSLPWLLVGQLQFSWLHARLGAARGRIVQRIVLVAAAVVLAWRGLAAWGGGCCGS